MCEIGMGVAAPSLASNDREIQWDDCNKRSMAPRVAEDHVELLVVKKGMVYGIRKFNLDLNSRCLTILACFTSS